MKLKIQIIALAMAVPALGDPLYEADPMVVTATRVATQAKDLMASVTVIDRPRIIDSQASDLLDLLRLEAGIDLARTGGPGSQTSVFMRGTNANHVLVLIDGVRVASPHSGTFAWEGLPLSQVERIEIVRGARASFYGSEAIGGVIQIFTRRASQSEVRILGGSYGTRQLEAGGQLSLGDGALWASAEVRQVAGFSAQNQSGFSFDPDDDGFEQQAITVGFEHGLGNSHQLRLLLNGVNGEVDFDQGVSDTETRQVSARLTGNLGKGWQHELAMARFEEERSTPAFFSTFTSDRNELDWRADYLGRPGQSWSVGVNLTDESGRQLDTFGNATVYAQNRDNQAAYAGWHLGWGDSRLALSARLDNNSQFGNQWTTNGAWGIDLGESWSLDLGYGTAFRAPTLSEQFSPGFGGLFAGNPELAPESSTSAEIRLRFSLNQHRLSLSAYRNDVDDLIAFNGLDFQAINIARARIDGFEAEYDWQGSNWHFGTRLTLQNAANRSTDARLLRRADEKLSMVAQRSLGKRASIGGEILYNGERQDFGASLDPFSLINLRARYELSSHWALEGRLENLTDEDYQLAEGFNTPDRSIYLGLRFQP
jgi:vitamin B12 transporter